MGKETIVALSYSHIIPFLHLCVFTYLHFYVFVFHLFTPLLSKIHLFYFLYSHPTPSAYPFPSHPMDFIPAFFVIFQNRSFGREGN